MTVKVVCQQQKNIYCENVWHKRYCLVLLVIAMFPLSSTLLIVAGLITGSQLCTIDICLKWKVRRSTLDLSCIVNKLHSRVEFYNQDKQIQGYCILPFPEPQCYSFNRRARLIQNKNVTTLTVIGINSKINGLWSCHHGTNIGESAVNISVVDVQGPVVVVEDESYECLAWTILPFLIFFTVCSLTFWSSDKMCQKPQLEKKVPETRPEAGEWKRMFIYLRRSMTFLLLCSLLYILPFAVTNQAGYKCLGIHKGLLLGYGVFTGIVTSLFHRKRVKYVYINKSAVERPLFDPSYTTTEGQANYPLQDIATDI